MGGGGPRGGVKILGEWWLILPRSDFSYLDCTFSKVCTILSHLDELDFSIVVCDVFFEDF